MIGIRSRYGCDFREGGAGKYQFVCQELAKRFANVNGSLSRCVLDLGLSQYLGGMLGKRAVYTSRQFDITPS